MEEWKEIKGHEEYHIGNYGRVKSFKKYNGTNERILKPVLSGPKYRQYYVVTLCKNGGKQKAKNHILVGLYFVDNPNNKPHLHHKNNNPLDNHFSNLEWVTLRENTSYGYNLKKTSSKFTGVCWNKHAKKWRARIRIAGRHKHLGYFTNEDEAAEAYQIALQTVQ